jgi:hypothetical protein
MEIYIPWKGFNGSLSPLYEIDINALEMASKFHPNWGNLKDSVKRIHARNCYQVLGQDLLSPSLFLICWTPKGSGSGGTGQAIRIANAYDIPVFDLGAFEDVGKAKRYLWDSIKSFI